MKTCLKPTVAARDDELSAGCRPKATGVRPTEGCQRTQGSTTGTTPESQPGVTDSILKEHRLTGDSLRFKQSLKRIELSVIREAELQFAVQSGRDTFDAAKRTMAYFAAIALNLQHQKNEARRQATARQRYGLDQEASQKRAEIQTRLVEQRERDEFEKHPETTIVNILRAEMNLPPEFRVHSTLHKNRLRQALNAVYKRSSKAQLKQSLQRTEKSIMELNQYLLEIRYQMIQMVHQSLKKAVNSSG